MKEYDLVSKMIRRREDGTWMCASAMGAMDVHTRRETQTGGYKGNRTHRGVHHGSLDPLDRQLGSRLSPIKTNLFSLYGWRAPVGYPLCASKARPFKSH